MTRFRNKILFVGYGAVAECTLPILFKHLKVAPGNVTVMDFEDRSEKLKKWTAKGVRFVRDRVTEKNLGSLLGQYVGAGDVIIDLAWNIDACEILEWCHAHGVLYVNTSTELWDPYDVPPRAASDREDAVLAAHERPPHDRGLEGEGPDGGARARRESRPDLALHEAGPRRHRHTGRSPTRR